MKTGHSYIGTELNPEYFPIADARVRHWNGNYSAWTSGKIESDLDEEEDSSEDTTIDLSSLLGF